MNRTFVCLVCSPFLFRDKAHILRSGNLLLPHVYLFIYLFIFAREKQIDFTDVSKITVRFQMIGNRTYALHEKCDLVTGKKIHNLHLFNAVAFFSFLWAVTLS